MIALGIDPSLTAFAYAVHDSSAQNFARRIASGHETTQSTEVLAARLANLRSYTRDLLRSYPDIEVVGIESPAYSAGPFAHTHFALMQGCLEVAFEFRKDVVLFDPASLKYLAKRDPSKFKGKVDKSTMQNFVKLDTTNPETIKHDEADAYVVAYFAARFMGLLRGMIPAEALDPAEHHKFVGSSKTVKTSIGTRTKKTALLYRENQLFFQYSRIPPGSIEMPQKVRRSSQ